MDHIIAYMAVFCLHRYGNIVISALQIYRSGTADAGLGINGRCRDCDAADRRIYNQVIGLRIPVKAWRQGKSVYSQARQLIIGASVQRRLRAGAFRHIFKYRNGKLQSRIFQRADLCKLRSLGSCRLNVSHILVGIGIASLHVKLLQVEGVLPASRIIVSIPLGTSDNGLLTAVPRPSVGTGLRCPPEASCHRVHRA